MSDDKPRHSAGVNLLLLSGRTVNIRQERATYVLVNRRFLVFLLGIFALSFLIFALLSGGSIRLQHKAITWFFGGVLVVMAIYFILYVLMNYASNKKPVVILSPFLSLVAVAVATPIVLPFLLEWAPQNESRSIAASLFFGAFLTSECAMMVFIYLVRDPLVERYENELRRANAGGPSLVRIGSEVFPLEALSYIEAENQYMNVHLLNSKMLIAGQLTEVERQLGNDAVFRPHRSFLVFRHGIATVITDDHGHLSIRTVCGGNLPVARRRVAQLREWLARDEKPTSETA